MLNAYILQVLQCYWWEQMHTQLKRGNRLCRRHQNCYAYHAMSVVCWDGFRTFSDVGAMRVLLTYERVRAESVPKHLFDYINVDIGDMICRDSTALPADSKLLNLYNHVVKKTMCPRRLGRQHFSPRALYVAVVRLIEYIECQAPKRLACKASVFGRLGVELEPLHYRYRHRLLGAHGCNKLHVFAVVSSIAYQKHLLYTEEESTTRECICCRRSMYVIPSCMKQSIDHHAHLLVLIKQCKRVHHWRYWLRNLEGASVLVLPGFSSSMLAFIDEIRECEMSLAWVSTDHYCTAACASACDGTYNDIGDILESAEDSFEASVRRLFLKRVSRLICTQRKQRGPVYAAILAAWWLLDLFVMSVGGVQHLDSIRCGGRTGSNPDGFVGCCKNWRGVTALTYQASRYVSQLLDASKDAEWRLRLISNIESGHSFQSVANSMFAWMRLHHTLFVSH